MQVEIEINKIIAKLQTGEPILPETAGRFHRIIAGQYAFLASCLIPLAEKRNLKMSEYRKNKIVNSEAEASRHFDLTEDGKHFNFTVQNMKTMEKLMTTLKLTAEIEQRSIQDQSHH